MIDIMREVVESEKLANEIVENLNKRDVSIGQVLFANFLVVGMIMRRFKEEYPNEDSKSIVKELFNEFVDMYLGNEEKE